MSHVSYTMLPNLASEALGAKVLKANDDFFAEKENLILNSAPIFIADKFTENGKWMDGWETRRRRESGFDWAVIKLGVPGKIRGFDVDTSHFVGNFPEACSLEACYNPQTEEVDSSAEWTELVREQLLFGGRSNHFGANGFQDKVWTHIRLNIFPDGGVARLKVYGEPCARETQPGEPHDLVSLNNGGMAVACSDMFFGDRNNLIVPGDAKTMGEGWETRRRRGPGNDWIVVKIAGQEVPERDFSIRRVEVDTNHFKGNAPGEVSLEACQIPLKNPLPAYFRDRAIDWSTVVTRSKVNAHFNNVFEVQTENLKANFLRLSIFPDGGVSRLRVFGEFT